MKQAGKLGRLSALILALLMVLGMSVTATAEGGSYSITIDTDEQGHTYEAYQIFTGTLSEGRVLSNIEWGNGVDGNSLLAELKTLDAEKYGECTSASEVAEVMSAEGFTTADAEKFAEAAGKHLSDTVSGTGTYENRYTISGLDAGYYLIKDQDGSLEGGDKFYTRYILQVVENVVVEPKSGTIQSYKKVKDTNDSVGSTTDWQDSADYDIGDQVPFKLTAVLPQDFEDYKTYKLAFHDEQSPGLTFQKDSVKVSVGGTVVSSGYEVSTEELSDGCTFEVKFENLRSIAQAKNGSEVTVEYTSVLNNQAKLGSAGNPNTMYLTFSNNPYTDEQGKTPEDKVIVFTYQVIVNKTDASQKPLAGAEFTLEKEKKGTPENTWVEIAQVETEPGTMFTFRGLDDGNYRLTETKTPEGYNTIDPITFTVSAEHDVVSDDPRLTQLSGNATTGEIVFTPVLDEGKLSTDVVNKKGSILPGTGGIGTTIFYVAGTALVLGASVLLVMKKRRG